MFDNITDYKVLMGYARNRTLSDKYRAQARKLADKYKPDKIVKQKYKEYYGLKEEEPIPQFWLRLQNANWERMMQHKEYPVCHCGRKYVSIDKAKECFWCSFTRK